MKIKYLFIDRDGTIIEEPKIYKQVDSIDKLKFEENVFYFLKQAIRFGYKLVMVSNQDGLGSTNFPKENFLKPHNLMLELLKSQNIYFEDILICPHYDSDDCSCRKPKIGLLMPYLIKQKIDLNNSFVIGDRVSDLKLAENLGIKGIKYCSKQNNWDQISEHVFYHNRVSNLTRTTNETNICASINLDLFKKPKINTSIPFLDHMLEQVAIHGGFFLSLSAKGDLHIDDHHTVEDIAITFGKCLRQALGDKTNISRYGFCLPMDESISHCSIDLSWRPSLKFNGTFSRDSIGGIATEMFKHFFYSLSYSLKASIHIKFEGENEHHKVEAIFKAFGKCLKQAIQRDVNIVSSSKGILE